MSKASFLTVTYNRPDLLRRCHESLKNQTDQDWEHLILDNGSTDTEVREVIRKLKTNDFDRVQSFRWNNNIDNLSVCWNYLLKFAAGHGVSILDDDNTKLSEFIAVMSEELFTDGSLNFVTCGFQIIEIAENKIIGVNQDNLLAPRELQFRSCIDGGSVLYRRDVFDRLGYFSEDIQTNEDWDILRRFDKYGKSKHLNRILATYGCHATNRTKYLGSKYDNKHDVDIILSR